MFLIEIYEMGSYTSGRVAFQTALTLHLSNATGEPRSMNKLKLAGMIRFQLGEMRARNAHHEFEHLSRHLARAKVYSNILPATGPVGAGGDEGRDFETYRSSVVFPVSAIPDQLSSSMRRIAFGCTLQSKIAAKIKSDITTIIASGGVEEVVYFCEANVPIARRYELVRWAFSEHNVELQIFDGTAISEMLAEPEVFWIAQEYLRLPAELMPVVPEGKDWYQDHYKRWREKEPSALSISDFLEVKFCLRHATFAVDARPHLLHWLSLMEAFRTEPATRQTARAAGYEIAVANLRGKNNLTPAKFLLDDYFSDLEEWLASSDLRDASTLVTYAFGGWTVGHFECDLAEILDWRSRIAHILDHEIKAAWGPGRRAALLRTRGYLAMVPVDAQTIPALEAGFHDWSRMLDEAEHAPLFPVEEFTDVLNKLAPMLDKHPQYGPLVERAEDLIAKRAGPAAAAEKSFDRAIASYERDDLLSAIRDLHRIQQRWFTDDRLDGFQRATFLLSRSYIEIGLAYAAKYIALAGSYLAKYSDKPNVATHLPRMLMLVADADDGAGNSLSFMQMLLIAIGAHCLHNPDPFDQERYPELRTQLGQVAALRGIAARLGTSHKDLIDKLLSDWPEALRNSVTAGSDHKDGFWLNGSSDEVWEDIEQAFIGRPFGELGVERRIEWRALGIRWIATFPNRYDETAIAEEFVAQLQIVQAAFAGVDLLLLPTTVRMALSLDTDEGRVSIADAECGSGSEGITISIRLAAVDLETVCPEEATPSLVRVAAEIIGKCSALPDEALQEAMKPALIEVISRVFLGRPYREIYRETMIPDLFREADRQSVGPIAAERSFDFREHSLLAAPIGPGYGYSKEISLQSVRKRYQIMGQSIRYTLERLLAAPQSQMLLRDWHSEGLRDWEILAIIANAAANLRFPLVEKEQLTAKYIRQRRSVFDQREAAEDALKPALFTDEVLTVNRYAFHAALASGWGLQSCDAIKDPAALEKFLIERYGLRSDDVEHDKIFIF
ncbi:hypothetical protein [Azospirillum sp. B2RO_4]|uniref:hypothetical protein n=1 Tax=Azospirillum sp. B2RO_4 TaxID=3027796 RepID=UPI003DA90BC3